MSSPKASPGVRNRTLRRTVSYSATEQAKHEARKQEIARTDHPIHRHADSLFSTSSGFSDFRGFLNLAVLLLVLSSARVALENAIKYGLLVDPILFAQLFISNPYSLPNFLIVLSCNIYIIVSLLVEKQLACGRISETFGCVLHIINLSLELIIPVSVILKLHPNPVFSSVALLICSMVFLKLISYKQTLKWSRDHARKFNKQRKYRRSRQSVSSTVGPVNGFDDDMNGHVNVRKITEYPDNLTLSDLYYFMLVPTLCYELDFPRSRRSRKRFLAKRVFEVVFISGLILALIQQWVLPLINNALVPFSEMQLPMMVERILKLALPNFCIWLLWFYMTFHSLFNVVGEILSFGDREFYQDWWNAESVTEFWQKWNIPVHRWAVRHLYKPMLLAGYSKLQGSLAVFILSAFFHELLVSVPLGLFRLYAFIGMLMQIPLAILTGKLQGTLPKLCNVIVWLSLIIGQPIAVLMYYVDYYIQTQTFK